MITAIKPLKFCLITNLGTLLHAPFVTEWPQHLVLAQTIRSGGFEAIQRVREMCTSGCWVILDNGAHEGTLAEDNDYLSLIHETIPSCVVLPDLIDQPHERSLDRSMSFLHRLTSTFPSYEGSVMVVPQGTSVQDIVVGFRKALREVEKEQFLPKNRVWFGFGQSYLQALRMFQERAIDRQEQSLDELARRYLIDRVIAACPEIQQYPCHVLGARQVGMPEPLPGCFKTVDSYKPFLCALQQTTYPDAARPERNDCGLTTLAGTTLLRTNIDLLLQGYTVEE